MEHLIKKYRGKHTYLSSVLKSIGNGLDQDQLDSMGSVIALLADGHITDISNFAVQKLLNGDGYR